MYKNVLKYTQNAKASEIWTLPKLTKYSRILVIVIKIMEQWATFLNNFSMKAMHWKAYYGQIKTLTDNLSDSDNFCYAANESIVM